MEQANKLRQKRWFNPELLGLSIRLFEVLALFTANFSVQENRVS